MTHDQIEEIKLSTPRTMLKAMFVSRQYDDLFRRVGKHVQGSKGRPWDPEHLHVWLGYETLIDFNPEVDLRRDR
jgi:hypothetical protein